MACMASTAVKQEQKLGGKVEWKEGGACLQTPQFLKSPSIMNGDSE